MLPPHLKIGDVIGIISPSDLIERNDLDNSLKIIKSWGLKTQLGDHVYDQEEGFAAGSAEDRFEDLIKMVLDEKIKMIWCSAGGFAATQLWPFIDQLFIDKLRNNPKFIMGYSDICILSHLWFKNGVGSIHGPNFSGFSGLDEESQRWTKKLLFGGLNDKVPMISDGVAIKEGVATGRLLCTNLDSLVACFGTNFDPFDDSDDNLILGLEEYEQFKSDIQRQIDMIMNHKKAFRIKGVILGKFRNLKFDEEYSDWYSRNETWEIISKRIAAVDNKIPIITWSNFGHIGNRFIALENGIWVELVSKGGESTLRKI